ncbi:flavin reductase family protein [Planobispora longispora]|uniref:Flavin reductase n=1 Tax=Planobispora longispora TaxID=28887 RepID=A0A8J3W7E8_9ACTN|nr:flavin reductase family protein [Planobispora longispora]BFE87675.1 flavin reductase family protein [Planobispora longispora]GIH77761.1 flavin reductase [Planobispora longispora]
MHKVSDLKVLYFGTPVVLISSRNPDGGANLAPMSSAWWLGQSCMLGLGNSAQTTANLRRERECVLNLAPSSLVDAVDRLAMTTGAPVVPRRKAEMGYRYEPRKFAAAGLTEQPSDLVAPPRVLECPIQLECEVVAAHPFGDHGATATAFHVTVRRAHVHEELVIPGTHYVDPIAWDPLIMKFCEFFGDARNVRSSRLAAGWRMPHDLRAPAEVS